VIVKMAGRHVGQRLCIARVTLVDSVKEGEAVAADVGWIVEVQRCSLLCGLVTLSRRPNRDRIGVLAMA
jgi:hypothetical protein